MTKKIIIAIIVVVVFVIACALFWQAKQEASRLQKLPISTTTSTQIFATSTAVTSLRKNQIPVASSTSTVVPSETKTYTNMQWGFEFQYPKDWEVIENPYGSPNLKFTLLAIPINKTLVHSPDPFLVSIMSSDFVKQQFSDIQNSAKEVVVDGVRGLKYAYEEESLQLIAIILPFDGNMIGIGTDKEYEKDFNQILSTFKFFK